MLIGFAVALVVALGLAIAWNLGLPNAPVSMLLPLLAALVGIVAARWSAYVAWTAVAVSLGMSAVTIFSGALDVEVSKIVVNPSAPWTPTTEWIVRVGMTWVVAILAVSAASNALGAARNAMAWRQVRETPGLIVTTITIGAIAWAAASWLLNGNTRYPLLEAPYWATFMTMLFLASLLLIAAAEAARGRLVPAVAEAEAVARRPFRPFKYLETVAIEALAGSAALRRRATADERSRLASDLHAEVLPSLAAIAAQYEAGAPKEDVAVRVRQLEEDVRALMAERRLVVLEEFGIVEAIEWLLGRAEERVTLEIGLSVDDRTTSERPPREVERAAFRIAQLAVENALQHAFPTKLTLEILARSDQVRISVADNGRGFADPSADRTRDHVGIADMRSQAAEVRGDVQVMAPLAGGTTVTFAWPAA
jgi:signal transduction histidine kinase